MTDFPHPTINTKFCLDWTRIFSENTTFGFIFLTRITLILKLGQGHQHWYKQVELNSGYHHMYFEIAHLNDVKEKFQLAIHATAKD